MTKKKNILGLSHRESLTVKQTEFCKQYLIDLNASKAAIRAGYSESTASEQAARLLANVKVKRTIAELMDQRSERTQHTADEVIKELGYVAFADIRTIFSENGSVKPIAEWPIDIAKACASVTVEELFESVGSETVKIGIIKRIRFWDKPRALELLGKHLKMFTEKLELGITLEELVSGQGTLHSEPKRLPSRKRQPHEL